MELNKEMKDNVERAKAEAEDVLAEAGKRLDDDEIGEAAGGVMRGFKCPVCQLWFEHASDCNKHMSEKHYL